MYYISSLIVGNAVCCSEVLTYEHIIDYLNEVLIALFYTIKF